MAYAAPSLMLILDEYIDFILLSSRIRAGIHPASDPSEFQKKLLGQLKRARKQCSSALDSSVLQNLEYAVVALLDEAMLSETSLFQEYWKTSSLQSAFYGTDIAGESFFKHLETALKSQPYPIEFLTICYLCLLHGFEGEIGLEQDKARKIQRRIQELRTILAHEIGFMDKLHLFRPQTIQERRIGGLPVWAAPSLGAIVIFIAFLVMWKISSDRVDALAADLTAWSSTPEK